MSRATIRIDKLNRSDRLDLSAEDLMFVGSIQHRFASREAAVEWYRTNPIPGFSGKTAIDLVQAGRIEELKTFVLSVDAGIHA